MPVLARRAGPLAAAGGCLLVVLTGILLLFGLRSALVATTGLALACWAVFGGAAAPALQAALAETGGANRGLTLALGASFLNAGTAASSALAAELHLLAPHWVAWQGAALIAPVALVLLWAARRVPAARAT
jgi:predicted MFS family arabinose efflux permease